MQLLSFAVEGFANLSRPVSLDPLDDLNVLCGPNNSGKSNVLRALTLYFRLLGAGEDVSITKANPVDENDEALLRTLRWSFHRSELSPIRLSAEWSIPEEDLTAAGLASEYPTEILHTRLEVVPPPFRGAEFPKGTAVRVLEWRLGEEDAASEERNHWDPMQAFARQTRQLLAGKLANPRQPYRVAVRNLSQEGGLFPQGLRDALFDARHSVDLEPRRRWRLFAELASTLQEELGEGHWETIFDRSSGQADLVFAHGDEVLSLDLMGAGAQRLAYLLAELCLATDGWICIEEPECHLSLSLQERLIALSRRVVEAGVGPRQLFLTTHSPTLAGLCTSFALRVDDRVPVLNQRAWGPGREAAAAEEAERRERIRASRKPAAAPGEDELHDLIGRVDALSEIEPEALLPESEAAPEVTAPKEPPPWKMRAPGQPA